MSTIGEQDASRFHIGEVSRSEDLIVVLTILKQVLKQLSSISDAIAGAADPFRKSHCSRWHPLQRIQTRFAI